MNFYPFDDIETISPRPMLSFGMRAFHQELIDNAMSSGYGRHRFHPARAR